MVGVVEYWVEFGQIMPIESRLISTQLSSAFFSFVIGKALNHLVSSETPACLDEPIHEWIPTEPFPTSAYITYYTILQNIIPY
jgi:hypothetical protein